MCCLENLRKQIHEQYLYFQRLDKNVHSEDFELAWLKLDSQEKEALIKNLLQNLVLGLDEEVKQIINNKLEEGTPFEQMTVRKLRDIGKNLKIERYNNLRKVDLLDEINVKIQRIKASVKRVGLQPKKMQPSNKDTP